MEILFSIGRGEEEGVQHPGRQTDADSRPTTPRPPRRAQCLLENLSSVTCVVRSEMTSLRPRSLMPVCQEWEKLRPPYDE